MMGANYSKIDVHKILENFKEVNGMDLNVPIFARVLRGKNESDFKTLTHDPENRKIVFPIDYYGLLSLDGKTVDEALLQIGYSEEYIKELRGKGYSFRLIVFEKNTSDVLNLKEVDNLSSVVLLANWENVLYFVSKAYPNISDKLSAVWNEVSLLSFKNLEADFREDAMGYDDLINLEGTPSQVRQFLRDTLCFTKDFIGNGYTKIDGGESNLQKGVKEYLMLNVPIESLRHVIVKF